MLVTVTNQPRGFAQAIDYETPQEFVTAWEAATFPNLRQFNSTCLSISHASNAKKRDPRVEVIECQLDEAKSIFWLLKLLVTDDLIQILSRFLLIN